jgi:hypothetical protein
MKNNRPPVDRSIKAYRSIPRIYSYGGEGKTPEELALEKKVRDALLESGIPTEQIEHSVIEIEEVISAYLGREASAAQMPRPSEQITELEELARRAQSLKEALTSLSQSSRMRILDVDKDWSSKLPEADPFALQEVIDSLGKRTTLALEQIPADRGGITRDANFLDLLLGISIAWRLMCSRAEPGVSKSEDNYRGPLVTLALTLLQLEGIRVQSEQAVGRQLYSLRDNAAEAVFKIQDRTSSP